MLDKGADVHVSNVYGATPLHFAAKGGTDGHYAVAEHLINAGADLIARSVANQTPLEIAFAIRNERSMIRSIIQLNNFYKFTIYLAFSIKLFVFSILHKVENLLKSAIRNRYRINRN